jgi:hypothetical protein
MALKLIWRFVSTVSKEGPDIYRMVLSAVIRETKAVESANKNVVIDRD